VINATTIERGIATGPPPNRLTTQRRLSQWAGGDARGCSNMRAGSNLYLTPARTGLIMITLLLLGVIVGRVIAVLGHSDVRTHAPHENGGSVMLDVGAADLRGSLP
jgi:hypothetical protein